MNECGISVAGQLPPGQSPPDNSPPCQPPTRQLPPWTIPHADNSPKEQLEKKGQDKTTI